MVPTDKQYVRDLAQEVLKGLRHQGLAGPFVTAKKLRIHDLNSGGWGATVGRFRGYQCSAGVWLDRFTAHETRKIYYCVYSNRPDGIRRLVALAKPDLGSHISIYLSDWSKDTELVQLNKPLSKRDFGKPVF